MRGLGSSEVWSPEKLIEGYSAMARDSAREDEAGDWIEELIGDGCAEA
jgi:hypothetical protein